MDPSLLPTPFAADFNTIIAGGGDHGIVQVMDLIDQGITYELAMAAYRIATAIEAKAMLRTMLERDHPNITTVLANGKLETRECYALVDLDLPKMVEHLASNVDATARAINMHHLSVNIANFRTNVAQLYVHPERAPVLPNISGTLSRSQREDVDHSRLALSHISRHSLYSILNLKVMQPYVDRARHVLAYHLHVDLSDLDNDSDNETDDDDESTDEDLLPPSPKRRCLDSEEPGSTEEDPTTPERVPAAQQRTGFSSVLDITMSFFENKGGQ